MDLSCYDIDETGHWLSLCEETEKYSKRDGETNSTEFRGQENTNWWGNGQK